MKINISSEIEIEDLIDHIVCGLSYADIVKFIEKIDLSVADWDFSLMLCEHFRNVQKEYNKEVQKEFE